MLEGKAEQCVGIGAIRRCVNLILIEGLVVVLVIVGLALMTDALAISSVNVPLDHWSYPAIEKLSGFGLLHSDLQGARPFTRLEMARLINEALNEKESGSEGLPPLVDALLRRLKKEFNEELSILRPGASASTGLSIKPLDELQARYVYSEGQPRQFTTDIRNRPAIRATEGTPLVENNEGVTYGEHHNCTLQFSSSIRYMDIFSAYLQPVLLLRQNDGGLRSFDEVEADLLKGYGKISPGNIEFELGRDSLWWGQGRHGSLLLTDNADPLDMLKISNPSPTLLPWIFQYLGPFKYSLLLSRLENDRVAPHPWLGGFRLDLKPFPTFEMGLASTFMFGGKDRSSLSFNDALDILTLQGGHSNTDVYQLSVFDARLRLPFLRNAELYAEIGGQQSGEKNTGPVLGDLGYLAGVYVPHVDEDGRTDLRVEYARNIQGSSSNSGVWYEHLVYRSGYTYDGLIMGHHMDGDASDTFGRVTHYLRDDVVIGLDFDYMERRNKLLSRSTEKVNQFGGDVTFDVRDDLSLIGRYGYETVSNFDLQANSDRKDHLLMVILKFEL